jgi:hypothetical protein
MDWAPPPSCELSQKVFVSGKVHFKVWKSYNLVVCLLHQSSQYTSVTTERERARLHVYVDGVGW